MISVATWCANSLQLLVTFLFFGNFDFWNMAPLGIFAVTVAAPVFSIAAGVYYGMTRSIASGVCVVLAAGLTGLSWYLWTMPAARGIVH
jgi:hypothetical protein